MRLIALLAAACALWTSSAIAGAWLREDGTGMIYLSQEEVRDPSTGAEWGYTTVYAEYGLRPDLTVGLDIGAGEDADDWKILVFTRRQLPAGRLPGRLSFQLGLGSSGAPGGNVQGMLRPAISWGGSFETPLGWAWANTDLAGEYRMGLSEVEAPADDGYGAYSYGGSYDALAYSEGYKLDTTLGLNLAPHRQIIAEIRAEFPDGGDMTLRFVPSLAQRVAGRVWLQLGGIVGLQNDDTLGLLLGSRVEF